VNNSIEYKFFSANNEIEKLEALQVKSTSELINDPDPLDNQLKELSEAVAAVKVEDKEEESKEESKEESDIEKLIKVYTRDDLLEYLLQFHQAGESGN
jgi:hypothetical protein